MKWIKCSERLPDKEGRYVIKIEAASYASTSYYNGNRFEEYELFEKKITHWLDESDHSDEEAAFTEEDIENLANEYITNLYGKGAHGSLVDKRKASFIEGYKAASKNLHRLPKIH